MKKCLPQFQKWVRVKFTGFIILVFSLNAKGQFIDFSSCANCNTAQINLHTEIKDKYLGVMGTNPSRPSTYNLLGSNKFAGTIYNVADAFIENNWHPIRVNKQILVGKIERFGVANYGDESDWNTHLSPSVGFESFLADAKNKPYKNIDEWGALSSVGDYTIEAEITPITKAFNNPWFNNVTHETYLLNKKIGVYGPFVAERLHGYKPEIHPSEQIWWKDTANSTIILLMADASNRFDEMSDYDANYAVPGVHYPWTQDNGQEAELKIPFEINPATGSVFYNLYSLYDNNSFHSAANYRDTSSGTTHTITYRGSEVLTIMESSTVEKYMGVTFRDVCFDNTKSMLKGYIILKTAIGNGGGGKEGFVALQLDKNNYAFNEKPGILIGDIINTPDNWTAHNRLYDNTVSLSDNDVISSDKYGKGIVDGIIDFNGNGKTDLFGVKGNKWLVLFDGLGQWQEINTASEPLKDLRFGDINGDGVTDILYVNSEKKVLVSMRGVQRWQEITDAGEQTNDVRVGDFNGDNKTDIVYMKYMINTLSSNIGTFNMYIKYGCVGNWQELSTGYQLNLKSLTTTKLWDDYNDNFRFGNFDGDNITDIFRYYKNKFMVYYSGKGYMQELCSPLVNDYSMNDFLFVDNLSRNGYTDVIYAKRSTGAWKIYYEGKRITAGRILKYSNPFTVNFGNLDNDALCEPFVIDGIRQASLPTDILSTDVRSIKMEPFVMPEYEKGSLKSTLINGNPVLTANLNLKYYEGNASATRRLENFESLPQIIEKETGKFWQYFPSSSISGQSQMLGKIKDVQFGAVEKEIEIRFPATSATFDFEVRPYGIGAVAYHPTEIIEGAGNWNSWKTFLSPMINPKYAALLTSAPGIVEKVKTAKFELLPFYSSMENGKVSLLEMGDMLKELNEIIYGDNPTKINEIFGSSSVFSIQWKFELRNIGTGRMLPMVDSQSISSMGKWANNLITFTFPEHNELLEFKASATITDKLGNSTPTSLVFIFYNQRLRLNDPKSQLSLWLNKVKVASGKNYEALVQNANFLALDSFLTPEESRILLK